jgi:putative effector of murein hydrolase LrgA (UPF0299 family)
MLNALFLILLCQLLGETLAQLAHLSLLFVPAGVGVMLHWERVRAHWQALALALVLGTLITLVVTALTMAGVRRLLAGRRRPSDG